MNNFQMTGTLTADAEIKQIGESNVINFTIANNDESKKNQDGSWENIASFFNCIFWSKSGKMVSHLLKGKHVTVSGSLKQDRWEKDGAKHSTIKLRCSEVVPHVYEKASDNIQPDQSQPEELNFSVDGPVPF